MNLADAIRRAAQSDPPPAPEPYVPQPSAAVGSFAVQADEETGTNKQLVRFECLLTSEQLCDVLGRIVQTMHPVMTLTEASRFLRLRTGQVSALAQNGSLPAFQVDGKWRFMKSALEEWMMQNEGANLESTGGGESNAA